MVLGLLVVLLMAVFVRGESQNLVRKWLKIKTVIGGTAFYDYVYITSVDSAGKIKAKTEYNEPVNGYRILGQKTASGVQTHIYVLTDNYAEFYLDSWVLNATTKWVKHRGVCSILHSFDSSWHAAAFSIVSYPPSGQVLAEKTNQELRKLQAKSFDLLREAMETKT